MTDRMSAAEYRASQQRKLASGVTTPEAGRSAVRTKKPATPTNALTKALLQLLTMEGCTVWRQNNAAVYDASFGGYRAGSTTPGIADILGYHRATGRFVAVEVKTGKDALRSEQILFLDSVRAAGGFACEGRSLTQVRAEYQQWRAGLSQ